MIKISAAICVLMLSSVVSMSAMIPNSVSVVSRRIAIPKLHYLNEENDQQDRINSYQLSRNISKKAKCIALNGDSDIFQLLPGCQRRLGRCLSDIDIMHNKTGVAKKYSEIYSYHAAKGLDPLGLLTSENVGFFMKKIEYNLSLLKKKIDALSASDIKEQKPVLEKRINIMHSMVDISIDLFEEIKFLKKNPRQDDQFIYLYEDMPFRIVLTPVQQEESSEVFCTKKE